MLLLVWILLAVRVVNAEEPVFATPVAEGLGVEYYDSGETRFAIFMEKVSWQEANKLCHSRSGGLVEYTKEGTSAFVGRALAESSVGFASLWVGGEFVPSDTDGLEGVWRWSQSQESIEAKLDGVNKFPMTSSPYWVDRPDLKARQPMCLATDRNQHHQALIVGEPCEKKRPYICSLPKGNSSFAEEPIKVTPPVNIGRKTFHLFGSSSATWSDAVNQCRILGMKLAKVTTAQEFRIIKNRMLRQRPIMENAWISGLYTGGQWIWADTSEPINVDASRADRAHPFAWYRPNNIIMDGCLLADRHLCDHFVYVEAKCDRRRNYICEKEKPGSPEVVLPPLIRIPGTDYYISTFEENWFKAQNVCRVCLGSKLMQIETTKEGVAKQLPILYTAMALTLQIEVQHIWIGGYLFGKKFKWASRVKTEPPDDQILNYELFDGLHEKGERGRLVYCNINFKTHPYLLQYKCLNLDRENQKYYTMYGLKCHHKQYFICMSEGGRGLDKECEGGGVVVGSDPEPDNTLIYSRPSTVSVQAVTTPPEDEARLKNTPSTMPHGEESYNETPSTIPLEEEEDYSTEPPPTRKTPREEDSLRQTPPSTPPTTGVEGKNPSWVVIGRYKGYWVSAQAENYSNTRRSCQNCLGGEILVIASENRGQEQQLGMINEGLKNTLTNPIRRIWLGSFKREGVFVPHKEDYPQDRQKYPHLEKHNNPYVEIATKSQCPALYWKDEELAINQERCTVKRRSICKAPPDAVLDKSCYRGDDED